MASMDSRVFWNYFLKTGQIGTYLLYRLCESNEDDSGATSDAQVQAQG